MCFLGWLEKKITYIFENALCRHSEGGCVFDRASHMEMNGLLIYDEGAGQTNKWKKQNKNRVVLAPQSTSAHLANALYARWPVRP